MVSIQVWVYGEDDDGVRVILDICEVREQHADSRMYRVADYFWRDRGRTFPDAQRKMVFLYSDPYKESRVMRDETTRM